MMNDEPPRQDDRATPEAADNAAVYAFLHRTRGDLIDRLADVLPIEAAINDALSRASTPDTDPVPPQGAAHKDATRSNGPGIKHTSWVRVSLILGSTMGKISAAVILAVNWLIRLLEKPFVEISVSRPASKPIPELIETLEGLVRNRQMGCTSKDVRHATAAALRELSMLRRGLEHRSLTQAEARQHVESAKKLMEKLYTPSRPFTTLGIAATLGLPVALIVAIRSFEAIPSGMFWFAFMSVFASAGLLFARSALRFVIRFVLSTGKPHPRAFALALFQQLDEKIVKLFDDSDERSNSILQN